MSVPPPILRKTGKPLTLSWSAIEAFDTDREGCARKWWYSYMEGRRAVKESTTVGDLVHKTAEAYLKGEDYDRSTRYWRILEPGLPFAPTPADVVEEGWKVEAGWDVDAGLTCGPLPFVGKVDFYHPRLGVVGDWKTTRGERSTDADGRPTRTFSSWTKTPSGLASFGQPLLYAKAIWGDSPPENLTFQHINLLSEGKPGALSVTSDAVPWSRVEETWAEAGDIAARMVATATGNDDATTVAANTSACKRFGGCDHAEYCAMSPLNRNARVTRPSLPTTETKVSTIQNTSEANARVAALRASLGLADPGPTPTGEDMATELNAKIDAATAKVTDPSAVSKAAAEVSTVLGKIGYVPGVILEGQAKRYGVEVEAVAAVLGIAKGADGKYTPTGKAAPAPTVDPTPDPVTADDDTAEEDAAAVQAGTPWAEVEALAEAAGQDAYEFADLLGMRRYAGMAVPVSWRGTKEEALRAFDPVTKAIEEERRIAAEENAKALAEAKAQEARVLAEMEAARAERDHAVEIEARNAQALADEVAANRAKAKAAAPPLVDPDGDLAPAVANLIAALQNAGGTITKTAASAFVRASVPGVQRVKERLWNDLAASSNGAFEVTDTTVRLTGALGSTPTPAPDRTPETPATQSTPEVSVKDGSGDVAPPASTSPPVPKATRVEVDSTPDIPSTCRCMILVDTVVAKGDVGQVVDFADWVGAFEDAVEAEAGVPHYGILDFGKGTQAVVAKVKAAVYKAGALALGAPVMGVSSAHPLAGAVLPILARINGVLVLKGVW